MTLRKRLTQWLTAPAPPVAPESRAWQEWNGLRFGQPLASGQVVTEATAFRIPAVSQAIELISREIATLPLEVWRDDGKTRELAPLHPAFRLLRWAPNTIYTAPRWRQTTMTHVLLYGNGISEIERDSMGRVRAIWPLEPWRVSMFQSESERAISYRYQPVDGSQRRLLNTDVLHIRAMDPDSGLWGKSPVMRCAEAIGLAQATQEFAAKFFGSGSHLSGVLQHPGSLGETAFKSLKASWKEAHEGTDNAFATAILEEGMEWKPTSTTPVDSQMVEQSQALVNEVARIFNVPAHRIGGSSDSLTYSNETQERMAFYSQSIRPWAVEWETEINLKILTRTHVADFNFAEALRADQKTRFDSWSVAIAAGWMEKNEVRDAEGMNEIPGLDDVEEVPPTLVDPNADPDAAGLEPDEDRALVVLAPIMEAAVGRVLTRQRKQLEHMDPTKVEGFFTRQPGAWADALAPTFRAFEIMGHDMPELEPLAAALAARHLENITDGVPDLELAWSAPDITTEILGHE